MINVEAVDAYFEVLPSIYVGRTYKTTKPNTIAGLQAENWIWHILNAMQECQLLNYDIQWLMYLWVP